MLKIQPESAQLLATKVVPAEEVVLWTVPLPLIKRICPARGQWLFVTVPALTFQYCAVSAAAKVMPCSAATKMKPLTRMAAREIMVTLLPTAVSSRKSQPWEIFPVAPHVHFADLQLGQKIFLENPMQRSRLAASARLRFAV